MPTQSTLLVNADREFTYGPSDDAPPSATATRLGLREVCAPLFNTVRLPVTLVADPVSLGLTCLACLSLLSGHRIITSAQLARGLTVRHRNEATSHRQRTHAVGFCRSGAPSVSTPTVNEKEKEKL
jgi:hypothetical protein